jgi:serine/threonine protein kinase, bacterial
MGFSDAIALTLLHPQNPANKPQQWHFDRQPAIRIGRSPDNDVVIDDNRVSRYHAEIQRIDKPISMAGRLSSSAWRLVNKGTNGTFLDGVLVSQAWVVDGSSIQLAQGGPQLKISIQSKPLKAASPQSGSSECTHEGNTPGNLFCIHCGQPLTVDRFIRQYQVLKTLGQGGMGTTYLAWVAGAVAIATNASFSNPGAGKLLVLKEMNADMAEIAKAQELFEREARTLKSLHHPGIPQFYDFFVEGGKKYLAMELVHGQDLEKRVLQTGPVTPKQAIEWMIQTCEVLDYIHRQNPPLIHRDIKPANLLVRTRDNHIVVLDFGAVKESGTPLGTRIGAEGYSAPEQDRGQPVTQSDLYAIGPTLIFLLTGESPHKFYRPHGRGYRFELENVPTIAPKLRAAIERVTKTNVRDRYPNARELAIALAACL